MTRTAVDWSRYAEVYDLMAAHNPAYRELHADVLARIAALGLPDDSTIADVGAGTGEYALALAEQNPAWRVAHVEPDPTMQARAVEKARDRALRNVEWLPHRADAELFAPGSLDLCVSVHALYAMPEPLAVLEWFRAWLRPGGALVLVDLGRVLDVADWRRFVVRSMRRELGLIGAARVLWRGRQVARQNRNIAARQRAGTYWTHSLVELRAAVETSGFAVEHAAECYRGCSDLVVARRA